MATIPQPRSYADCVADIVDPFLAKTGLKSLKAGSGILSLIESAAQSDLRSTQDIFQLLDADSLDNAEGDALIRAGADEGLQIRAETSATGYVSVSDTSFTKVSTRVYQGQPAPIAGTQTLYVQDASLFPASGNLYVGRGTVNYEGPLAYTATANLGSYWSITLASPYTQRFHNQGESVILAQGGLRTVPVGQIVQCPQGNLAQATQYRTLYAASIQDGDVLVAGIEVVALKTGVQGNVPAGQISQFSGLPFTGAAVTNPLPINNGLPAESPDQFRERIRAARASRAKATLLAIESNAVGVESADESKRVLAAALVGRTATTPPTLFIDSGNGYEEANAGVAVERLVDSAVGGEYSFKIANRPVAKASVVSTLTAPFALQAGQQIGFTVGGKTTAHTLTADQFRAIGAAEVQELVDAVNADPTLNWGLRSYGNGTQVAAYARVDVNESIQYAQGLQNDANPALGFPTGLANTMWLYRNDRLLSKDGAPPTIVSNPFSSWGALGPTEDLQLQVDGTSLSNLVGGTYTIAGADFVAAGTGYASVGRNTVAAWAQVLQYKIPGISATVQNGLIVLASNRGASSTAALKIAGGSLVTKGMFSVTSSSGLNSDYVLDRNTGELLLSVPLVAGDALSIGSPYTRAFLQSAGLSTVTLGANGLLWFVVDGAAQVISHSVTASTTLTYSNTAEPWGVRQRLTSSTTGAFSNVQIGDWAIFWDPTAPAPLTAGAFRVCGVDASGNWVDVETATAVAAGPGQLASAGLVFARTTAQLTQLTVPSGTNYTAGTFAPFLAALPGLQAAVFQTTAMRVNTNTHGLNGDLALVAANSYGQLLQIPTGSAIKNLQDHVASQESGNRDLGTPDFHYANISSATGAGNPTIFWSADSLGRTPDTGTSLVGSCPGADSRGLSRWGDDFGYATGLQSSTSAGGNSYNVVPRANPAAWYQNNWLYLASPYRFNWADVLAVVFDGDTTTKRYAAPMARTLKTQGTTYASTNTFKDGDNGNASLAVGFGFGSSGFDFNDFAVHMAARAQTHLQGDSTHYLVAPPDLTKTILWRYYRLGADGEWARVRYVYPTAPAAQLGLTVDSLSNRYTNLLISLAGGAAKSGWPMGATNKVGVVVQSSTGSFAKAWFFLGLAVTNAATNAGNTQITITLSTGGSGATDPNITVGSTVYVNFNSASFTNGTYAVALATTGASPTLVLTGSGAAGNLNVPVTGTCTFGTAEQTLTGASPAVAAGDYFRWSGTTGLPADYLNTTMAIQALPNPQTFQGFLEHAETAGTQIQWYTLGDAAGLSIFAPASQTASTIAAAVNALAGAVRGTVIGSGAGTIALSTTDEAQAGGVYFNLTDGLHYVQTTTVPGSVAGDYQLQFKDPIAANLATNSDWANEVVKLVPTTAKNVVDWLSAPTVTGIGNVAEVLRSSRARKVQLASLTAGSGGSVQVQGGGANSASAALVGAVNPTVADGCAVATANATDLAAFTARAWVAVTNGSVLPKAVFDSNTKINTIAVNASNSANYDLTFDPAGTPLWTADGASTANALVQIEQQGNFVAIRDSGFGGALVLGGVQEGDWIRLSVPATTVYYGVGGNDAVQLLSTVNAGIFRVVRVVSGSGVVWIENPAASRQLLAEARVDTLTAASLIPGDYIQISTSFWDGPSGSNKGQYLVVDVGNTGTGSYTSRFVCTVQGPMKTLSVSPGSLGTLAPLLQAREGVVARYIKQILSVVPNPLSSTLADIKFTTSAGAGRMGGGAGSVMTMLDKLSFGTDVVVGVDGYRYATGLLQEVNRVEYGDPGDPATYPGVVAAGSHLNIEGSRGKRIQLVLSIRAATGAALDDVRARIKSAVAAYVNGLLAGESVSLSRVAEAAQAVAGVVSVVVVKPAPTVGADLIAVQPFEKPRIFNVDQDVLVNFVGG